MSTFAKLFSNHLTNITHTFKQQQEFATYDSHVSGPGPTPSSGGRSRGRGREYHISMKGGKSFTVRATNEREAIGQVFDKIPSTDDPFEFTLKNYKKTKHFEAHRGAAGNTELRYARELAS